MSFRKKSWLRTGKNWNVEYYHKIWRDNLYKRLVLIWDRIRSRKNQLIWKLKKCSTIVTRVPWNNQRLETMKYYLQSYLLQITLYIRLYVCQSKQQLATSIAPRTIFFMNSLSRDLSQILRFRLYPNVCPFICLFFCCNHKFREPRAFIIYKFFSFLLNCQPRDNRQSLTRRCISTPQTKEMDRHSS